MHNFTKDKTGNKKEKKRQYNVLNAYIIQKDSKTCYFVWTMVFEITLKFFKCLPIHFLKSCSICFIFI